MAVRYLLAAPDSSEQRSALLLLNLLSGAGGPASGTMGGGPTSERKNIEGDRPAPGSKKGGGDGPASGVMGDVVWLEASKAAVGLDKGEHAGAKPTLATLNPSP